MRQNHELNDEKRLNFKDVTLYFLYTTVLEKTPNFQKIHKDYPNWKIEDEKIDERLYHPRYIHAVSPTKVIIIPPLRLRGIDINSFNSIVLLHENIYQKLVENKPKILDDVTLNVKIRVYPGNMCSFILRLVLSGEYEAEHLIALINGLLDHESKVILQSGESVTLTHILSFYYPALLNSTSDPQKTFSFYETFSLIVPKYIEPELKVEEYFKEPFNYCLFGIAIRRIEHFRDFNMELTKQTQKNLALYDSEIVILNYHNMFAYVSEKHLSVGVYLRIVESLKVLAALLHYYDITTYKQLSTIEKFPTKLRELKHITEELEANRINALRTIDTFRMLTSASATRVKMLMDHGIRIFGLNPIEESLDYKLREIEELLAKQYNLQLQKQLQVMTILLAIFSILITVIEVIGVDRFVEFVRRLFGG